MNSSRLAIGSTLILLVTISSWAQSAAIRVGLSKINITPPVGGETTGYASAKSTDGIHDSITARVLVLKSKSTTVALVAWDLCIFNSEWLHEQSARLGIDILLLSNTHTHAGPNMRQHDFPSTEQPWKSTVERRTLEAIKDAQSKLFTARISASAGELTSGYNRLIRQPGGFALTEFNNPERRAYGPTDSTVPVLRITDELNNIKAVLVNHACHPVVLGPRNRKISAGYPGVMRRNVESTIGNGAMCIFIQGGAGDINPIIMSRDPEDRSNDFALVETLGTMLSDEVLSVLKKMGGKPGRSNSMKAVSSTLEFEHRFNPSSGLKLGVASILINDDIAITTMPGEPFHKFQKDLRNLTSFPNCFFFGYTSNAGYPWPSYLPDAVSAAHGGYGASDTTKAEVGAGERLLIRGVTQLFSLQGRLKSQPQRHINKQ